MIEFNLWDHLFAFAVFIVYPLYEWRTFPAYARLVEAEGEPAKINGYVQTVARWLGFAAILALLWAVQGRDWAELGFRTTSPFRHLLGVVLGCALLALIVWQWRSLLRDEEALAGLFDGAGQLAAFMPRTGRELKWFYGVSINAGLTEEMIWRGFLLAYLEPIVGIVIASVLSVAAFTFGHIYQGAAQLPAIAFLSSVFVALYLVSGSLLCPIVFHALVDVVQGRYIQRAIHTRENPRKTPDSRLNVRSREPAENPRQNPRQSP